jgi:glycine cleavage system H protein
MAMTFPEDLRYTKEHEWLRLDGDVATVGITDYAQGELGDIVFVELNDGFEGEADEVFGTIEAVKTVSDLFLPVAGEVVEINDALDANPEKVNEDPYGEGWMVRIRLADPSSVDALMSADEYRHMIGADA